MRGSNLIKLHRSKSNILLQVIFYLVAFCFGFVTGYLVVHIIKDLSLM